MLINTKRLLILEREAVRSTPVLRMGILVLFFLAAALLPLGAVAILAVFHMAMSLRKKGRKVTAKEKLIRNERILSDVALLLLALTVGVFTNVWSESLSSARGIMGLVVGLIIIMGSVLPKMKLIRQSLTNYDARLPVAKARLVILLSLLLLLFAPVLLARDAQDLAWRTMLILFSSKI